MTPRASFFLLLLAAAAQAGPRTSANYSVTTETTDAGGRRATSASYTNDSCVGAVAGVSTVAAPAVTAKHGYIGQLFEVTGLSLTAASLTVNEGATDQLAAWQVLDDATFLAVPATSVTWSVLTGPLTGINASGLATAGIVYQNTSATAQGVYLGHTASLALNVANSNLDNFGAYAGDTLDDAWQVQYFGLPPNALAGPLIDPDGDGQTNAFEFVAGLVPTNPLSVLRATPALSGGELVVSFPSVSGKTYTLWRIDDLPAANWVNTGLTAITGNGAVKTFTIPGPISGIPKRFYRIQIGP